jgi:hypothetical protein
MGIERVDNRNINGMCQDVCARESARIQVSKGIVGETSEHIKLIDLYSISGNKIDGDEVERDLDLERK